MSMVKFCRRYGSDLLVLAACIGFGFYVFSESRLAGRGSGPWDTSTTRLALSGQ